MAPLSVRELPGIGRKLEAKLNAQGIHEIGDLTSHPLAWLQKEFGHKTGEMLHNFSRGNDSRAHEQQQERKSIGIDCNWGVRMTTMEETIQFLLQLSEELSNRLETAKVSILSITLKLRVRSPGAPLDPSKFLGLGVTDGFSRSITISTPVHQSEHIHAHCVNLFQQIKQVHSFPISDLRGIGISGQKLCPINEKPQMMQKPNRGFQYGRKKRTITLSQSFPRIPRPPPPKVQRTDQESTISKKPTRKVTFDPLTASQLDPDVLSELPEDIQSEVIQSLAPRKVAKAPNRAPAEFLDDSHEIEFYSSFRTALSEPIQSLTGLIQAPLGPGNFQRVKSILSEIGTTNLEDAQTALSLIRRSSSPKVSQLEAVLQDAVFGKYKGHLTL